MPCNLLDYFEWGFLNVALLWTSSNPLSPSPSTLEGLPWVQFKLIKSSSPEDIQRSYATFCERIKSGLQERCAVNKISPSVLAVTYAKHRPDRLGSLSSTDDPLSQSAILRLLHRFPCVILDFQGPQGYSYPQHICPYHAATDGHKSYLRSVVRSEIRRQQYKHPLYYHPNARLEIDSDSTGAFVTPNSSVETDSDSTGAASLIFPKVGLETDSDSTGAASLVLPNNIFDTMSSSSGTPESWISSFCSLLGHEYFAEISEDFIEDDFNLTGLQTQVAMYKEALEMILDVEPEEDEDEDEDEEEEEGDESIEGEERTTRNRAATERRHQRIASDLSIIESSAEMLYGLIHQRFICSRAGIQQMSEKYELAHFGVCPRTFCEQVRTLPVGLSDVPGEDTVKLFCPSCLDVYVPPNSRFQTVDGAFFGRTFGALFLLTFPDYDISKKGADTLAGAHGPRSVPASHAADNDDKEKINGMNANNLAPGLGRGKVYEPKIYGFKVSERARSGPRMAWLRKRPNDIRALDEAAINAMEADESDEDGVPTRRKPNLSSARPPRLRNGGGSPMSIEANGEL